MRKRELEQRLLQAEQRFFDWQNSAPSRWGVSVAGPPVGVESSAGLPAVSAAIRLVSETMGLMPCLIYRGEQDPANREKARDAWQWERLHNRPNDDTTAFDFWQDVETSIETDGNAFIYKAFARRPVQSEEDIQLFLLPPAYVTIRRDENRRKYYEVWRNDKRERISPRQMLHIRGWTLPGSERGASPITLHRESLGKLLATEEFESRFFSNHAQPPFGISFPGDVKSTDVDEFYRLWAERHSGAQNYGRPAMLFNGATFEQLGISQQDAQFIEQKRYGLEDIARMFRISAVGLLGAYTTGQNAPPVDDTFHLFLQADMGPRIRRIEMALRMDPDLFPGADLFPEFQTDMVLRPDIRTRYAAYKDAAQGGWLTGNEIREKENLPAHPDGVSLQQTPVGGAPNTPNVPSNGQGAVQEVAPMGG